MTGKTRDYTGRTVDMEFLQTEHGDLGELELSLTSTLGGVSRRVAGVQKAVQRYVALLLTTSDSVRFPEAETNTMLSELRAGTVSDMGYMRHLFNTASAAALDIIRRDDYNTTRFGPQAEDEKIASVDLANISISYESSTISLSLVFRTEAGSDYAFVVPVSARQE